MFKIKTIKLGKVFKKLFSRQNVFLTTGVILIVLGAAVWVLNFSLIKPKTAKAIVSPCAVSGCFEETWTATEVTGNAAGMNWGASLVYAGIRKEGDHYYYNSSRGYPDSVIWYAVKDSPAEQGTGSYTGQIVASAGNTPTKWSVIGKMTP